jgi:thioredoxin 1
MKVLEINQEQFEDVVLKSKSPVLVDFWAPWCGPCKMIGPKLEQLAEENDSILVVKVNVDDNRSLSEQFQVRGIPTLLLFKDGTLEKRSAGAKDLDALRAFVN